MIKIKSYVDSLNHIIKKIYRKLISVFIETSIDENPELNEKLIFALKEKRYAFALRLIKKGANPNIQSSQGSTLLMRSAQQNDLDTCKFLIKVGALTQIENNTGETAADIAEKFNNMEIILYLLNAETLESPKILKIFKKYWREILVILLLIFIFNQNNEINYLIKHGSNYENNNNL